MSLSYDPKKSYIAFFDDCSYKILSDNINYKDVYPNCKYLISLYYDPIEYVYIDRNNVPGRTSVPKAIWLESLPANIRRAYMLALINGDIQQ